MQEKVLMFAKCKINCDIKDKLTGMMVDFSGVDTETQQEIARRILHNELTGNVENYSYDFNSHISINNEFCNFIVLNDENKKNILNILACYPIDKKDVLKEVVYTADDLIQTFLNSELNVAKTMYPKWQDFDWNIEIGTKDFYRTYHGFIEIVDDQKSISENIVNNAIKYGLTKNDVVLINEYDLNGYITRENIPVLFDNNFHKMSVLNNNGKITEIIDVSEAMEMEDFEEALLTMRDIQLDDLLFIKDEIIQSGAGVQAVEEMLKQIGFAYDEKMTEESKLLDTKYFTNESVVITFAYQNEKPINLRVEYEDYCYDISTEVSLDDLIPNKAERNNDKNNDFDERGEDR